MDSFDGLCKFLELVSRPRAVSTVSKVNIAGTTGVLMHLQLILLRQIVSMSLLECTPMSGIQTWDRYFVLLIRETPGWRQNYHSRLAETCPDVVLVR